MVIAHSAAELKSGWFTIVIFSPSTLTIHPASPPNQISQAEGGSIAGCFFMSGFHQKTYMPASPIRNIGSVQKNAV